MALFLNETFSPGLPDSTLCFRRLLFMCVVSNVFHHRPLSAPEGLSADPREAPREGAQEGEFWELAPGDVTGKPVKYTMSQKL